MSDGPISDRPWLIKVACSPGMRPPHRKTQDVSSKWSTNHHALDNRSSRYCVVVDGCRLTNGEAEESGTVWFLFFSCSQSRRLTLIRIPSSPRLDGGSGVPLLVEREYEEKIFRRAPPPKRLPTPVQKPVPPQLPPRPVRSGPGMPSSTATGLQPLPTPPPLPPRPSAPGKPSAGGPSSRPPRPTRAVPQVPQVPPPVNDKQFQQLAEDDHLGIVGRIGSSFADRDSATYYHEPWRLQKWGLHEIPKFGR